MSNTSNYYSTNTPGPCGQEYTLLPGDPPEQPGGQGQLDHGPQEEEQGSGDCVQSCRVKVRSDLRNTDIQPY